MFGGISFFFFRFLYFERTRPAASMRPPFATFTSLLLIVMKQGRESEATEAVFAFRQKSLFIPRCVQGAIIQFVCRYVCVRVCV